MRNRIVSAFIAFVLVAALLLGMDVPVGAAADGFNVTDITYASGTRKDSSIDYIHRNDAAPYTIEFYYEDDAPELPTLAGKTVMWTKSSIAFSSNWKHSSSKNGDYVFELRVSDAQVAGKVGFYKVTGTISPVVYDAANREARISVNTSGDGKIMNESGMTTYSPDITFNIPDSFFERSTTSGGNSSADDDPLPTTDILIEAVYAYDKDNKLIDKITKDTKPFSIEIIYSDYGVIWEAEHFESDRYEAYVTELGGFNIPTSRGTLTKIVTLSTNEAPRFRVRFSNVTYKEGANTLGFRVHYDYYGDIITGKATATVSMVDTKEDEEEAYVPPATPHIIINQYSYGEEPITAGNDFVLNLSYQNTSNELTLENIVMTVTPKSEHVVIAAASNTVYIRQLSASGVLSHPVALAALPAASGSQNIDISFKYEYIVEKDSKTKERRTGEDMVSIAVPFIQIDRFTVDPIPENTDYIQVGDQFFMTVSFVNEGKSPIYNISAMARGTNREIFSGVSRVEGALQASANNELEIDIVSSEAGELQGEIVISYEDENMSRKEIIRPFTVYIEERYIPSAEPNYPGKVDPGMMEDPEKLTLDKQIMIPSIVGGLLIAAVLARYVAKRVIAKEKEELNEDF